MVLFGQEQIYMFVYDIFIFFVFIIVTLLFAGIARVLINTSMKSSNPLIVARIKQYASILIWTTGIILGVSQLGLSTDILILLMGLTGLAFIVSAVYVLQNSVSRSFLNINIQYKVGDVLSIKNFSGKVIEITSLNTILLDKEGKLIAVPNVEFLKDIWIKHKSVLEGYEITIPIFINKGIDTVSFEKELLESIKELNKYLKKEPSIITSKTNEKTIQLSLILNLIDPEKKSVISAQVKEIVDKLISGFTERSEKEHSKSYFPVASHSGPNLYSRRFRFYRSPDSRYPFMAVPGGT